jgi:hypothetical protein
MGDSGARDAERLGGLGFSRRLPFTRIATCREPLRPSSKTWTVGPTEGLRESNRVTSA